MLKIQFRKLLMLLYDAMTTCFLQTPSPELHASFKTKTKAKILLSAIRQHLLSRWTTKLPQICGSFLVAYWLWWLRIITCSNSQPKQKHSTPRSCAFGNNKILTRCIKGIVLLILYWFHLNIGQYFLSCIGVFSHCVYLINYRASSPQVEQYSNNLNFFFDVLIRSIM